MAGLDNRFRIAVDIGGTFTDIALLTDAGLIHQSKVSTTPADPSLAVIDGVRQLLAELAIPPEAVAEVLHGTTVGSNTILQRKGARTGLITTQGFRDVLEIGRIRMAFDARGVLDAGATAKLRAERNVGRDGG